MKEKNLFEVIIIGGSFAGLSAAMTLGRSLRNTLVIDSGEPCNRQTPHSHNFLTQDGNTPTEITKLAKSQVEQYESVQFQQDKVIAGKRIKKLFAVTIESGKTFTAKKLIFATGIKDIMPPIKGFSACWGITVIHCPYCHGYEFRNKRTGIMANAENAFHLASLVNNLTKDITILTLGSANFTPVQMEKFQKHNIKIEESEIVEIEHRDGHLSKVVFKNGKRLNFEVIYASIPFEQQTTIPIEMGCKLTEMGFIEVNAFQKTSEEGIFACGDNTTPMRSIANAVSGGNFAGAMINKELTDEDF